MDSTPHRTSSLTALGLGLVGAVLFVLLAGVRIGAQGPQYDELHQAAGAFTWLGSPPPAMFCRAAFDRVCVLNMPYSAAIKTNLYGAFLRLSGARFTLSGWRIFGLLLMAGGIVLFAVLAGPALPPWALAVFLALLLTDSTVLLLGRFDWGPVALALVLRLALIGVWLRGEAGGAPAPRNSFTLGVLVGLAAFEKLSSCVLVLPLAVMTVRRAPRHLAAAVLGLALGALPLAAVNLGSLVVRGELISLAGAAAPVDRSLAHFRELLALGQGGLARSFLLGLERWKTGEVLEIAWLAAALLIAAALARRERLAGVALLSYIAVGIGLFLLPRPTWIHHWILATPFQVAAVVLALNGRRGAVRFGLAALVALGLAARLVNLVGIERALLAGAASPRWDPSLARIGAFAAARADRAVFIASDWGVATQIHCFANGRPGLVHEPFWDYRGPAQLRALSEGKRTVYLVRLRRPPRVRPGATDRIERDLAVDPLLREVPAEPEAARFREVLVRKFVVRRPP